MKKKVLSIILLLISFLNVNAQNSKLDAKNGFDSFIFGTAPNSYTCLTLEIEEGNTKLYNSSTRQTSAKDLEFEDLSLTFNKNRLSVITIRTTGQWAETFMKKFKEMYGEPTKSNKPKGTFEWLGSKVQLVYELNAKNNSAVITFYSKIIK